MRATILVAVAVSQQKNPTWSKDLAVLLWEQIVLLGELYATCYFTLYD
jgi:hypothetical protein